MNLAPFSGVSITLFVLEYIFFIFVCILFFVQIFYGTVFSLHRFFIKLLHISFCKGFLLHRFFTAQLFFKTIFFSSTHFLLCRFFFCTFFIAQVFYCTYYTHFFFCTHLLLHICFTAQVFYVRLVC